MLPPSTIRVNSSPGCRVGPRVAAPRIAVSPLSCQQRPARIAAHAAGTSTVADPSIVNQGTPLKQATLAPSYDAVVIGSGIGGLAAAVVLSQFAGRRVLVLEQHYTAGGFTHAFRRGKYAWNVGVHYIGGGIGEPGGEFFGIFNALSGGQVAWCKQPEVYDRIVIQDRAYDFVVGREAWLDKMSGYFPKEREALKRLMALMQEAHSASRPNAVVKALPGWMGRLAAPLANRKWTQLAGRTMGDVLSSLTQDQELRAVLAGQYPDIGLPPGRGSAAYHLMLLDHYMGGGSFVPAGGASTIAQAMVPLIEAAGGAVVTGADVAEIVVEGGRVAGVRLATGQEVRARTVISNAGLINTYTRLLPAPAGRPAAAAAGLASELSDARAAGASDACSVLYLGLRETRVPEFSGLGNIFKHPTNDLDGNVAAAQAGWPLDAPLAAVYLSCCDGRETALPSPAAARLAAAAAASDVGAAAAAAAGEASSGSDSGGGGEGSLGVSTLQVIAPTDYAWFEKWAGTPWRRRGAGYDTLKAALEERLMAELGAVFPALPGRVEVSEVSTPLSTEFFSRWPRGGIYGLNATPERFVRDHGRGFGPRTPVPGLFLTGQDVMGDGVAAALLSGVVASAAAGGPRVMQGLGKELKKWE